MYIPSLIVRVLNDGKWALLLIPLILSVSKFGHKICYQLIMLNDISMQKTDSNTKKEKNIEGIIS